MKTSKSTGYFLAILAALLWGVSGTLAQFLFQNRGITPEWLVTTRLLISGIVFLIIALSTNPAEVFKPFKNKVDSLHMIGFGIFGMLAVQYTYFAAIKHSNAATATILQYSGPVLIACYSALKEKRIPSPKEIFAIILAMLGTFLIVTHGSLESLSITSVALFWGLISAVALAVYSILPINLMNKYQATVVVGWGMLIGGLAFSLLNNPFAAPGEWDLYSYLFSAGIILLGTMVAFYSYMLSVKIVGPTVASLLACAEPLSAALIAVLWLNTPFGMYDGIGTVCILITITMLTGKEAI